MRVAAHLGAMRGRLLAVTLGAAAAATPHVVAASSDSSRALDVPGDTAVAVALTALGIVALFGVTSVAFLYRKQRGLRWDYQLADGTLSEGEGESADHDSH
ncbi:MAG: hypothetical protein F4X26_08065 [Chloroflexi bacterium]|nr:hypothetical protein [Chloroflexota bacterium]MYD65912.1 hypothetical protein [Chloroflexota bacterium]